MEVRRRSAQRGVAVARTALALADAAGRRIGKPDLLCEELDVLGEYDGAGHREAARQADDVGKEDRYRNTGLEAFRVVGRDLANVDLVVARMRAAVVRARTSGAPRSYGLAVNPPPVCRP